MHNVVCNATDILCAQHLLKMHVTQGLCEPAATHSGYVTRLFQTVSKLVNKLIRSCSLLHTRFSQPLSPQTMAAKYAVDLGG